MGTEGSDKGEATLGELTGIEGHLRGDMKTQCSRNSLKSMTMTIEKSPSSGEYRVGIPHLLQSGKPPRGGTGTSTQPQNFGPVCKMFWINAGTELV